jgi:hypothetical protein
MPPEDAMKISKEKIMSAIDMNPDEGWTIEEMREALQHIEDTLSEIIDMEVVDNDYYSYAIGDASNLVQVVRESL